MDEEDGAGSPSWWDGDGASLKMPDWMRHRILISFIYDISFSEKWEECLIKSSDELKTVA